MANKKRLIDANALRKRLFSYYSCVNENSSKEYYKGETLMTYEVADMIEDCIDNAPTVDAVEVVHGRWNKSRLFSSEGFWSGFGYGYACSICGDEVDCDENDALEYNYCPNCGAKMDGGAE